jgi:CBS domain-containing protein
MHVRDILQQKGNKVVTIEVDKTVHDAICKLNEHGIGALVVMGEDEKICGIVTERDILRECGQRCARLTEPSDPEHSACPALVKDVMTKDLIISVPSDDLAYVMGVMSKNRVRHLPILDEGKLVGIISIGDVVNVHAEETEFENRMLKDYVHGPTY